MRRLNLPRREVMLGLLGTVAAAGTDIGYLMLLSQQGAIANDPYVGRVLFVALFVAGIATAGLAGTALLLLRRRPRVAQLALGMAAAGAAALGVLGIFSIGVGLLLTSILLAIAAVAAAPMRRGLPGVTLPTIAITVPLLVLAVGFIMTGGL
jgi:hypothetical protein